MIAKSVINSLMIDKIERGKKDIERIQTQERRKPRKVMIFDERDAKTICTLMTSEP